MEAALSIAINKSDFEIRTIEGRERAVFNKKFINKGDIVVEYVGELITYAERKKRETIYEEKNLGCFIVDFQFREKNVY